MTKILKISRGSIFHQSYTSTESQILLKISCNNVAGNDLVR